MAEADVEVTLVERRPAPGGHWLDTYPFVRLHTPSAYYGVNSLALGEDRIDEAGENAGYYERATGEEVCGHFAEAAGRLGRTGQVRVLTEHEHAGRGSDGELVRDLNTGVVHEIAVRRKVVDARYLEASVPATHTRPFEASSGARVVPVSDLPAAAGSTSSYTVLGAGKTAVDACTWLLENGVEPDAIRWVRPRDAWFHDRRQFQPLEQVGGIMEGSPSKPRPAPRRRTSTICSSGWRPRGGSSASILPAGRDVPRDDAQLPRAARRAADRERGQARSRSADRDRPDRPRAWRGRDELRLLHVDCTALGLRDVPAVPIFQPGRIVLQQVRHLSPSFNAALLGFVEAHREEDADKNASARPTRTRAASRTGRAW